MTKIKKKIDLTSSISGLDKKTVPFQGEISAKE